MQLVAYGAQDVYLTGNPQITLFKVVYRRHTNFSVECVELSLDTAKPGARPNLQVLRNGDLATKSYLRVELPALAPTNAGDFQGKVAWVRRLGHAMIKTVEITIGGSQIDKHWGTWLDVWSELTLPSGQERGYAKMIGDVPQLTTLSESIPEGYQLYVPLQFWFCRNYGLALPLIALQYHDVRLNFEFEEIDKLVVFTRGCGRKLEPSFSGLQYKNAGVLIDYVYLDSEERRRFAQVGHEYLIEQLQTPGEQNLQVQGSGSAATNQNFTLNFNHPCKEIIWTHKLGAFNGQSRQTWFLAYSNFDSWVGGWENAVQEAANNLAKSMISVEASNPFSSSNSSSVQPVNFQPANEPIVTYIIDGITWKFISVNTTNLGSETLNAWILRNPISFGNVNLASGLVDVTVELDFQDLGIATPPLVEVTVTENNLSLANLSIPLTVGYSQDFVDRRLDSAKCNDVHIVQFNNYGLTLDGQGNMVVSAKLVLNGHDRFEEREGSYFNNVQPWQHHTRTPKDGINVYCFALKPEEHQPTGTANMSRIDTTKLIYKTQDVIRAGQRGLAALNYTFDTIMLVFCTNYNVLRVMSGMGGMAYSN